MKRALRWRTELRDDGVWEPPLRRFAPLALLLLPGASLLSRNPNDGWMLVFVIAMGAMVLWTVGFAQWGLRDRLVFGLRMEGASGNTLLIADNQRIAVDRIQSLLVRGPLAKRELMVFSTLDGASSLLVGGPQHRRDLAEQYLLAGLEDLPFKVEIQAPESPFLQPDTVF